MKVILHADDFGFDKDTTEATIELLEEGSLTSASIMATMPAVDDALDYAAAHKEKSFGVHLTYVDGLKSAYREQESSLLDAKGLFYPSNDVRKKAIKLSLRKQDIVEESLAQIEIVKKAGIEISHLDSHGHLHKFPSFLLALPEIKMRSGIERVRRVQNVFIHYPRLSPSTILNRCFDLRISRTCRTTDYFYMSANSMDTEWAESIIDQMNRLPEHAIIEIAVHPGKADTEEERWRISEYKDIRVFASLLRKQGKHQLITWKEV